MRNIVNIINFIRGAEPRDRSLDLIEPIREQIALMKKYDLPGTFLVQYDAMLREDVLELLRPLDRTQFELGVWLEMNQPHVEAAGFPWRGRPGFEWDWHAHVGFSVGYTPAEREKLVDVTFARFEECFQRPARSVGSWMIDAHTLAYIADRYGVVASCNCKDQWGTDGYTIWGGYWNQGYYPSRRNVLCPAQTPELQIPVPVFRMLGSDPVTQYDLGLRVEEGADECQKVASLEPVYDNAGADPAWVDWFMRQNFQGGSLAFAYAQAGQENSFGWPAMKRGLEYQFPLLAQWRKERGLRVERLEDTGCWYRSQFASTPATAVSALEPFGERQAQSVWYDCKNYRANVYCDAAGLRLRDVTLFDEKCEERYLRDVCRTDYLVYENLPVMDGNRMSGNGVRAGAWLVDGAGQAVPVSHIETEESGNRIAVRFDGGSICFDEDGFTVTGGAALKMRWDRQKTSFVGIEGNALIYERNGARYALCVKRGRISGAQTPTLSAEENEIRCEFRRQA